MILDSRGTNESLSPNYYSDQFSYTSVPKIVFDNIMVPMNLPQEIWITDTTFRDGQQAKEPYTPAQIEHIFKLLSRLGGPQGIIRQTEFFLYSKKDKKAVEKCLNLDLPFPEITGWIRAVEEDLQLVKQFELKETGILTSVSDYHIYMKLKSNRKKTMESYLKVVKNALDNEITPRCHFEDITRADFYGFVLPFAEELKKLSEEVKGPVKIRLCDTMGFGLAWPGVALPRSIPKMIHLLTHEVGIPSTSLEWHGHNDFHKVHANASSAWLYGVSSLNASLFGIGERTGNPPLEAALVEYWGLKGNSDGMDLHILKELSEYYQDVIKYPIPDNMPFVGKDFNTTRAGIHADGLIKNEQIYNIFDTKSILNRPITTVVTDKSGVAGIARWINENSPLILKGELKPISKNHPCVRLINAWVVEQFENGRTTSISSKELKTKVKRYLPNYYQSNLNKEIATAQSVACNISANLCHVLEQADITDWDDLIEEFIKIEGTIQLTTVVDHQGLRVTDYYTNKGERLKFKPLKSKSFDKRPWFESVRDTNKVYVSDLYFSEYTEKLIITVAYPLIKPRESQCYHILDVDFVFDMLNSLAIEEDS
ncbi:triose-phosphate isomerase [Spirochaeta cellobiosiphila]|uniref:triose-phosphate isomerase n=1 Tax=Spirochaeta cellobiosiphila TaxID=504483 RepID=UPI00040C7AAA|nr:histone-lysine N-methyltransferase [Spirochaeta cellobiosiphila]